ncbi:MAG: 1-deoxy-D-xylulose-5-phosphate synthase [Deltaproteobacteria bacterium]|nr:1-deoxy-D-xylulose-5-phosphate synthase [Deltaproteobacteria bacterium]
MTETPKSLLAKTASDPSLLRDLDTESLRELSSEIRREIISTVGRNGGHLASSLGAVELIVALHRVFDPYFDRLIFDVGHQAYAHKLLTPREPGFRTLRQAGGISGFPKISESPADAFGTGHSSTSISAALGLALARDLKGESRRCIAVIGDGALTGGMALEALNHAGGLQKDILVVFNDNRMSISPNVGAISQYLSLKLSSPEHVLLREKVKNTLTRIMPQRGRRVIRRLQEAEESLKSFLVSPRTFMAAWGFKYLGPIDGHSLEKLVPALLHVKLLRRPVFLHVLTTKGKGYAPAEDDPLSFHGMGARKAEAKPQAMPSAAAQDRAAEAEGAGVQDKAEAPEAEPSAEAVQDKAAAASPAGTPAAPRKAPEASVNALPAASEAKTYTEAFGRFMTARGRRDPLLCAVTAAMSQGTGLTDFFREFPERSFDVGIAEQHAVTLSAGLAAGGMRPVCAVYSTFLQRAFDQLFHDVALQGLPVVFAVDRAGLVGEDGPTHHGGLDLSYLRLLPGFTVMAPKDGTELEALFDLALSLPGPSAVRYPRGACPRRPGFPARPVSLGKAELMLEGDDLALIAAGDCAWPAFDAARALRASGISAGVVNVRFIKPLDEELILAQARRTGRVLTVEENSRAGGLYGAVAELLLRHPGGLTTSGALGLSDAPAPHGPQAWQRGLAGLDAEGIRRAALALLQGEGAP